MAVAEQAAATNHYRIEERIGGGGMGTVFRAVDLQLNRPVALKVLTAPDGDLLDRFLREQQITAELDHPGFVRILSVGYLEDVDGARPFYTMPLIQGLTLEELIRRRRLPDSEGERLRREFTLTRLLQLMQQLCLTMQSAHDKRIVHRDLKPANIILGPYDEVYVTDLGLAKHLLKSGETVRFEAHVMRQLAKLRDLDLTHDEMMGTPYYMAPEQSLSPRSVDHRADIFGLGALLYYVLTGQRPKYADGALDRDALEARRRDLVARLAARGVDADRNRPRGLGPEVQALLASYDEIQSVLAGSTFHRFRFMMKEGAIVPPREALAAAGSPPDGLDDALQAICMKALAKEPADRFASCRELWKELQQYLERRHELEVIPRGEDRDAKLQDPRLDEYAAALREFLAGGVEPALKRASDLGRRAVEEGRGILATVLLHGRALRSIVESIPAAARARAFERAEPFLAECLGPFDMAQRGVSEAYAHLRDLTERQEALVAERTREVRSAEAKYRNIFNQCTDAVILIDPARLCIVQANARAGALFGCASSELHGLNVSALFPEQGQALASHAEVVQAEGRARTEALTYSTRDGRTGPAEVASSLVEIEGTPCLLSLVRDITERKRVEGLKDQSISVVSHELRTPLTSIRGSLGLIAAGSVGDVPAPIRGLVEIAYQNCERLTRLVDDLLDIQKLESVQTAFQLKPVSVAALAQQAVESTRGYAEVFGVSLMLEGPSQGCMVLADEDRLIQVLTNLLSNAAKFSPRGERVLVSVERREGIVRVSVTDRGPGIPDSFRPRVFQKFAQAASPRERRKGSGLGLSIARAIIEKMGGRIGFESEPAQRTTFFFELTEWMGVAS